MDAAEMSAIVSRAQEAATADALWPEEVNSKGVLIAVMFTSGGVMSDG